MTNLEETLKSVIKTLDDLRKHCSYTKNRVDNVEQAYFNGAGDAYEDIAAKLDDLILAIKKRHPGIED